MSIATENPQFTVSGEGRANRRFLPLQERGAMTGGTSASGVLVAGARALSLGSAHGREGGGSEGQRDSAGSR